MNIYYLLESSDHSHNLSIVSVFMYDTGSRRYMHYPDHLSSDGEICTENAVTWICLTVKSILFLPDSASSFISISTVSVNTECPSKAHTPHLKSTSGHLLELFENEAC